MDVLVAKMNALCEALPFQTGWYLKDLNTEAVPAALPDGTPGFAAAYQLIGRMPRLCWDALG